MKVLIIGGTGAMGVPLREQLINNGNEVVVTSRSKLNSNNDLLTYVQGDGHDDTFLFTLIENNKFDAIVDFMVYKRGELKRRVNFFLTNTKQYIYLSSCRVFANTLGEIKENSDRLKDVVSDSQFIESGEYAISKAEDEDLIFEQDKSNWTIIRPYITYFNNRFQLGVQEKEDWLFRALSNKPVVFSRDISEKYTTMTSGLDVADCIFKAIGNNKSLGRAYNCVSSEYYKWKEVLEIYKKVINELLHINLEVCWVESYTETKQDGYQVKYDRMFDRKFNNERIRVELGKNSFTSLEDGIKQDIGEFISEGKKFGYIYWERQAIYDRICNSKTNLNKINGFKNRLKYFLAWYGFRL